MCRQTILITITNFHFMSPKCYNLYQFTVILLFLTLNVIDSGLPSITSIGFGILQLVLFLPSNESFTVNSVASFFQRVMHRFVLCIFKRTYFSNDYIYVRIIICMVGLPRMVRCRPEAIVSERRLCQRTSWVQIPHSPSVFILY